MDRVVCCAAEDPVGIGEDFSAEGSGGVGGGAVDGGEEGIGGVAEGVVERGEVDAEDLLEIGGFVAAEELVDDGVGEGGFEGGFAGGAGEGGGEVRAVDFVEDGEGLLDGGFPFSGDGEGGFDGSG